MTYRFLSLTIGELVQILLEGIIKFITLVQLLPAEENLQEVIIIRHSEGV